MKKMQKWGLPVPEDVLAAKGRPRSYWGARGIYTWNDRNPIDLMYDRQTFDPDHTIYPILLDWSVEKGLPWLQKELKSMSNHDRSPLFRYEKGMYGIVGQTRGRYVYIGAWRHDTATGRYELTEPDPSAKWTGDFPIPKPGCRVMVTANQFGSSTVIDYSVQDGYLGIRVRPDRLPEWFVKQNPFSVTGTFYGPEMKASVL